MAKLDAEDKAFLQPGKIKGDAVRGRDHHAQRRQFDPSAHLDGADVWEDRSAFLVPTLETKADLPNYIFQVEDGWRLANL